MTFARPPAGDDALWPRASAWLDGSLGGARTDAPILRVVGVPTSVGSISASAAWRTPSEVRAALQRLSPYDPVEGIDLARAVRAEDLGDWDVAGLDLQSAMDRTGEKAAGLDVDAAVHVFLGGDNAITRPVVTGLHGPDLDRVGVITLDAHHDVRHLDDGPRNGTPIRGLVADGIDPTHVVQLGIGRFTNSRPYADWCREHGIGVVTMRDVHANGIGWAVDRALAQLDGVDVIHLDVDMDVLDVAYAPACPGARPGGMTPDQLFEAVRRLGGHPRVRSADLVEVDPTTDEGGRTVMATAMALLAFAVGVAT